ncbi:MAG: monovalent cation/H+ antiporter complex subunit F [Dehalococcoidia bacterium]
MIEVPIPFLLAATTMHVLMAGLSVALALTAWRLAKGPTMVDRIVAIDVLASIGVGLLLLTSIEREEPALVDVALLVALVSFVAVIAFAQALPGRGRGG